MIKSLLEDGVTTLKEWAYVVYDVVVLGVVREVQEMIAVFSLQWSVILFLVTALVFVNYVLGRALKATEPKRRKEDK